MSNRQQRRERHLFADETGVRFVDALGQGIEIGAGPQLDKLLAGSQLDDVAEGVHIWAMFAVFRCPDPAFAKGQQAMMDSESLLMVTGPGCYRCEQGYSAQIAGRPCPGEPS